MSLNKEITKFIKKTIIENNFSIVWIADEVKEDESNLRKKLDGKIKLSDDLILSISLLLKINFFTFYIEKFNIEMEKSIKN